MRYSIALVALLVSLIHTLTPAMLRSQERTESQEPTNPSETLYSGPQPGEALPPFTATTLLAEPPEEVKLGGEDQQGTHLVIFVHQVTRPSLGLARHLVNQLDRVTENRPSCDIVFLSDDPTETRRWAKVAQQALPQTANLTVYGEGIDGPGSYGLNRDVTLTILIARDGKVASNFALVQPGTAVDGPRILKELAEVAQIPEAQLMPVDMPATDQDRVDDETFRTRLRPLLNREATAEQIAEIVKEIDALCARSEAWRKRLGDAASRIVASGNLGNYGNEHAQEALRRWAKELGPQR